MEEVFFWKNKEDYEQAVELLQQVVTDYPHYAPAWGLLGHIYYTGFRQPNKSLPFFRRACKLSPRSEMGSLGLFHSLWDLDRKREAMKELLRFQSLGHCQDYAEILAEVQEKTPEWLPDAIRRAASVSDRSKPTTKKGVRSS